MIINFDSTQLIADAKEDIMLFGDSFKVYAIYAYREIDGIGYEYIKRYIDAEKSTSDEADTQEEYNQMISEYDNDLASLKNTKNELMTLSELLDKLIEQNRIV